MFLEPRGSKKMEVGGNRKGTDSENRNAEHCLGFRSLPLDCDCTGPKCHNKGQLVGTVTCVN